ncbi:MAG: M56 family metallopeptidase [Bacteroidia bacterium]|nr:M56 family metallopeptidase [Bacteroidia bacterium]
MIDAAASFLQQHAGAFLSWYLPMQIQTGIFVLLILAIDALLPNASPRFRYALWMTALVKSMLPPVISLPVGDVIATQVFTLAAVEVTPTMRQSVAAGISIDMLLTFIIIGASLVLATVAVWRAVSMRRMLADARVFAQDDIQGFPPIFVSQSIPTPLAAGFFHRRIYITPDIAAGPRDSLLAVLNHEATHFRRGDAFVVLLQTIVQIVYALNPLVWLLNLRIFRYREEICDEEALRRTGVLPQQYGRILLSFVAEQPARLFQTGTCFFETRRGFARRIMQLFNNPEKPAMKWKQYLLVAVLSLAILPLSLKCSEDSPKEADVKYPVYSETLWENGGPDSADYVNGNYGKDAEIVGGLNTLRDRITYPEEARDKKIEGLVLVDVDITAQGTVKKIQIKKSVHPLLDAAALEAVGGLTFKPAEFKGVTAPTKMTIPIKFKLH